MTHPFIKLIREMPWTARIGIVLVLIYAFVAFFAPWLATHPEQQVVGGEFEPWSSDFLLGTDNLGRDVFSRLLYGARNTIGIAFATTVLAFCLGGILGLVSATNGSWLDQLLSRLVDIMMAIPQLIFALLLLSIFGISVVNLILIIGVLDATRIFRLTRAVAMNVTVMEFVEAAKLRGESQWWIIRREILPNITTPLISEFGLRFCFVFLSISALSFLGLGLQPPTADWGGMVRDTASLISFGDITPLLPAAAIAVLTVAVNFVVDWLLHRASGLKE